ncbi:hypothetical protein [Methylocystis sp.]|jgi:hypothetical protein|uniref:hypothetical protein n=1 Tax=Methylocystis sp. TaxID=1911079 RepID=UPI003DA68CD2
MKLAQSQRCALYALAGLAAVLAAPALAGDDKSTWSAMMEMVGASSDERVGKIDYSERPKLVLPPRVGDLPPPRERGARSGEWPTELSSERRRNADRYARVPNAPPEEKKKGLLERIRGPRPTAAPGTEDEPGFLQRVLTARTRNAAAAPDVAPRRMLVEPPDEYRQPTKDLSSYNNEKSGKSWWNPLSWGGGSGSDSDPVAQTGNPNAPSSVARSSGGGLSSIMPSFLRGSDKN